MTVVVLQSTFKCVTCASDLDRRAQKCMKCQAWQNWKRFLPESQVTLALLISLISVISAVVPPALGYFANRSLTYVRILGDRELQTAPDAYPQKAILVLVANNGKRPSLVKSASISFEGINAVTTELDIHEEDQKLVGPETQVRLHLTTDDVERTKNASAGAVFATITVTVEETDFRGNMVEATPQHRVAATAIADWMARYVPAN